MQRSITDQLPLNTMDAALYPTRGSIESIRTAAIRQMWQALRTTLSRRLQRAPIAPHATAAAC